MSMREQIIDILEGGGEYTSRELSEMVSIDTISSDFYKVVRAVIHKMKLDGLIEEGVGDHTWRLAA